MGFTIVVPFGASVVRDSIGCTKELHPFSLRTSRGLEVDGVHFLLLSRGAKIILTKLASR